MLEHVLNILSIWLLIFLSGHSTNAFIKYVKGQWGNRGQKYIDSQVEFVALNKHRIGYVLLQNHVGNLCRQLIKFVYEKNASSLSTCLWLDNEGVFCLGLKVLKDLVEVCWQGECLRKEVEFFWELFGHFLQMIGKEVFSCNLLNAWEVIDLLVWLQSAKNVIGLAHVVPEQITVHIGFVWGNNSHA